MGHKNGCFSARDRQSGGIPNSSEILNNFDIGGSRRGKGDFWDVQEHKRHRQHVQAGGRKDDSRGDHENHKETRNDVEDSLKKKSYYHDERRRHSKYDRYEDRSTHQTEISTSNHGKSGYCGNRRCQWREQHSYGEWEEQQSGSSGGRSVCCYENRLSDCPAYRSSIESSFERQSDGLHRYRKSDFSPPDLRRIFGAAGCRKHRDDGRWRSTHCDQRRGFGTANGHHNHTHYDYALRSGYNYAYYAELYRTNPTYRQQVDAYYARLGYRTSLMQPISEHTDPSYNSRDPQLDNSSSSRAHCSYGPRTLDYVPRLEEVTKFPRPHPLVRFCGVSSLLKLMPSVGGRNVPQPIEIHSLRNLLQSDPQFRDLQAFPGPLVKSETHKDNVIHFCKDKIRSFAKDPTLPDRYSQILLWELLILMVRQNGFVSGSDIAELLVRDYEPPESTGAASILGNVPWDRDDTTSTSLSTDNGDSTPLDEGIVVSDSVRLGSTGSSHTVSKFREFLFFGRTKPALDWAAKHGLWGHALCLASKMDAKTYVATLTRFTNSLPINDPLRTLYRHLSGRQPTSVTCAAAEKWGNWRPHLAMILSNPSTRPEANARNIVTLGDALASRSCLAAAHFCYLVAHVEFGTYDCKSSKLVLLGSCHQTLSYREFASNEAIQATEIYEYARSLADTSYMLPHLLPYKFLLAMRLAEYGFAHEALHYCEVLARALTRHCWSAQLATKTYELASRLKYHDARFIQELGELEELGEPPWLAALARIVNEQLQETVNGTISQVVDSSVHENGYLGDGAQFRTDNMLNKDGVQSLLETTEPSVFRANAPSLQEPENHFSWRLDAATYWSNSQAGTTLVGQPSPMLHTIDEHVEQPMSPPLLAAPPYIDDTKGSESDKQWDSVSHVTNTVLHHPTSVPSFVIPQLPAEDARNMEPELSTTVQHSNVYDYVSANHHLETDEPHAMAISEPLYVNISAPPTTIASTDARRFDYYKEARTYPGSPQQQQCGEYQNNETDKNRGKVCSFDYYNEACIYSGPQQQQCGTYREHTVNEIDGKDASDQRDNRHSIQSSPHSPADSDHPGPAKGEGHMVHKKRWLVDGIIGALEKLVPKGPNQMILPDDRDPGIVWDERKKCWVDKNAAPEELDSRRTAPPPDSSFGDHPQNPLQNRFQLNKQRRRRYVDVQNVVGSERSGNSVASSSSMVPFMLEPATTQAPPQFFVPCIDEQHSAGCDFVSAPPPLSVDTPPVNTQSPSSESPAPYETRTQPTMTLKLDVA